MAAAGILGASGLTSIFGRVGTGIVADRVGAKRTLLSALSLQAALIFLYLFATSEGALWTLSLAFGLDYGARCRLRGRYPEVLGDRVLGTAYGGVFFISCIGWASAPVPEGRSTTCWAATSAVSGLLL